MVTDTDPAAPFQGGVQNDSMTVALDNIMNQGALTQDPGYLSLMQQFQLPQVNTEEFDPSKALLGGALMDISNIILGRGPQNMPMKAYQMGRQMYQQDRTMQNQQAQQNFQNRIAVGSLVAQLQKAGLPSSSAGKLAMDFFGKDLKDLSAEEMKQLGAIAKQFSASTNITVENNQAKGNSKGWQTLADQSSKNLADFDSAAGNVETLDILDQMELVNQQIEGNGLLSSAADVAQGIVNDTGIPFTISDETSWRDLYKSLSTKLALKELQAFKGPTTDFEYGKAESVNGSLSATQEGRSLIIQTSKAQHLSKQEFASAYYTYGLNQLKAGEIPSMTEFKKTPEYLAIARQTVFMRNPQLMSAYRANMDDDAWDSLVESRGRQLDTLAKRLYPNLSEEQQAEKAQEMFNEEFAGLL